MRKTLAPLLLAAAVLSTDGQVHASGFAAPAVGPSSTGVTSTDPSALALNPGAIGFLDDLHIVGGGNLIIADLSYQRERLATYQYEDSLDFALPIDPVLIDRDKRGADVAVDDRPLGVVPAIFGAAPIAKLPLVFGLGVYIPYAAMLSLPKAGPQRFQIIDAFLAMGQFTPTLAYRFTKQLSVGASVSYVLGYASLSKVQDLATLSDLGEALARPPIGQSNSFGPDADPGVRELDTMARRFEFEQGIAHGVTFSVGTTVTPVDDLWIAASYEHSTQLTFRGDFRLDMNDPFFTQDLQSQGLDYPALVKGRASLSFKLPHSVRLGVRYDLGKRIEGQRRASLSLEGSYTGWSTVDDFDVRIKSKGLAQPMLGLPSSTGIKLARDWRDTYGGRVRMRYALSGELAVWGAVGLESGASPDATIDMASPDGTRVSGALGLSQRVTPELRVILDAQLQVMLDRHVVRSDYDLGNGTYQLRIAALGAYLDYAF